MAYGNLVPTRVDSFIKSSVADFQDPSFLTFVVDFFPTKSQYPRNDGLFNDNLLMAPAEVFGSDSGIDPSRFSRSSADSLNSNQQVEYATYDWLSDYYGGNYANGQMIGIGRPHPKNALLKFVTGLKTIQSSPWYFQSVSGINGLWKANHRTKEGDMKGTVLTFNCLESVKQPLTDVAENYRYAIYDDERLSYRVPENQRWFDMTIDLIEVRDLRDQKRQSILGTVSSIFSDPNQDLFIRDRNGVLTSGLKVIRFRCKMCEFDFSDFLGEKPFNAYVDETPFYPSFKVKVGWVVQDEVLIGDADDIRLNNMLAGILNPLSNKLSNAIRAITRLPGSIAGSVINDIQTRIQGAALGNVYEADLLETITNAVTGLGARLTGRVPAVGPQFANLINTDIYPNERVRVEVKSGDLGDIYMPERAPAVGPGAQAGISVGSDIYPNQPAAPTGGSVVGTETYPAPQAPATKAAEDDVYSAPGPPTNIGANGIGDVYA